MPIAQVLILLYAGMMIENPEKRKQFIGIVNGAGESIEKTITSFMGKGGTVNEYSETVPEEPTEFR